MFRPAHLMAMLLLASPAAFAQPDPNASSSGQQQPAPAHMTMRARFEAANTTRDGRLTPDQAQAGGMRAIARHFAEIDADHKGYVTFQDIRAWHHAKRAARTGGGQGTVPPAGEGPTPPAP